MSIYSFTFTLNLCFWEWKTGPQPHSQLDSVLSIDCLFCLLFMLPNTFSSERGFFFFFLQHVPWYKRCVCFRSQLGQAIKLENTKPGYFRWRFGFSGSMVCNLWQGPKYKHCSYFYLKFGGNRKYSLLCVQHEWPRRPTLGSIAVRKPNKMPFCAVQVLALDVLRSRCCSQQWYCFTGFSQSQ